MKLSELKLSELKLSGLKERIEQAIYRLRSDLVSLKGSSNHWTGTLSTSALSTATAVSALSICRDQFQKKSWPIEYGLNGERYSSDRWDRLIEAGSGWLSRSQNSDGGFGDTDRSLSNIATTFLVLAAWQLAGHNTRYPVKVAAAWDYVERNGRWEGLKKRYGKDKTFVVPIMTNCALAGFVDWKEIPTLPFEAAALPQAWYRFVQLPVVSYAIPALVAIGQAQYFHNPPRNPITRIVRSAARESSLRVLTQMQPTSGGYLEAVPLTSFVLMSLASIGLGASRVAVEARKFIIDSVLEDGSWPIDTNLAAWVTSLAAAHFFDEPKSEWDRTIDWLLSCQHVKRHPFTGAEPGGWGWTNLSGAVPDSDDTPAALLALNKWHLKNSRSQVGDGNQPTISTCTIQKSLERIEPEAPADFLRRGSASASGSMDCPGNFEFNRTGRTILDESRRCAVLKAARAGCRWLVRLQNRDGGWPTFCRGWGTLPFDRSGSDLTAHAIRALSVWREIFRLDKGFKGLDRAIERGWTYLEKHQKPDGSWLPLWFGNQDREEEDNPIYGTGRVLLCYSQCHRTESAAFQRGRDFLLASQNADGGWGGGYSSHYPSSDRTLESVSSTIEETSVALEGILSGGGTNGCTDSIMRGVNWLCDGIQQDHHHVSQPIGFYFARLWYHEKMYPLVFSLGALNKGLEFCQR